MVPKNTLNPKGGIIVRTWILLFRVMSFLVFTMLGFLLLYASVLKKFAGVNPEHTYGSSITPSSSTSGNAREPRTHVREWYHPVLQHIRQCTWTPNPRTGVVSPPPPAHQAMHVNPEPTYESCITPPPPAHQAMHVNSEPTYESCITPSSSRAGNARLSYW